MATTATYADAWTAARDAGWSPTQLKAMGYETVTTLRKRTGRTNVAPVPESGAA